MKKSQVRWKNADYVKLTDAIYPMALAAGVRFL